MRRAPRLALQYRAPARAKREAEIVVLDSSPGTERTRRGDPRRPRRHPLAAVADGFVGDRADRRARQPVGRSPRSSSSTAPARARLNDEVFAAAKRANWPLATATLELRKPFAASLLRCGVTEDAPSSLAAAEMRLLAREVMTSFRTRRNSRHDPFR
ncbi:MAG: hypothetical protein U1E87_00730 [Alphaproteobacteria bacterium]